MQPSGTGGRGRAVYGDVGRVFEFVAVEVFGVGVLGGIP